jgi:hypothetical protein
MKTQATCTHCLDLTCEVRKECRDRQYKPKQK